MEIFTEILDFTYYLFTELFETPFFEYFFYSFVMMFIVWFYRKLVIWL